MIGDTTQINSSQLIEWIDSIPFSRPAKNLTRDFSDAVLTAEILKLYYPRHVELHNYVPANSVNTKKENWRMLNRKVLVKLDIKLSSDTIHQLANGSQGAIEKLLMKLRLKILQDGSEIHGSKLKDAEEEKIINDSSNNNLETPIESSNQNIDNKICEGEIKSSKFMCFKQGILVVFSWIICFFRIWNIFNYRIFRKHDTIMNVTTDRIEDANDDNAKCTLYAKLKQELCEKEKVISTLNHKIAYLESSVKLKDLRLSSLAVQIFQNADINQSAKLRSADSVRTKLRSQSHYCHESKTN